MGASIILTNYVHISTETRTDGCLKVLGYKGIDAAVLKAIVDNKRIETIQISDFLPDEAYRKIDEILALRPDITFRLYHFLHYDKIDISFLLKMSHLTRLRIDFIDFRNNQQRIDFDVLSGLRLKSFHIDCFDLRDYGFIQSLSVDLEELVIMADTLGPGIAFDCSWILQYKNLNSLWLGKKAKKNLESINKLPKLKSLTLRGIKIKDFSFLFSMNLERLALLWNSNSDLRALSNLKSLKEIELWHINKLEEISFLEELTSLEIIKLQDLKHIVCLPNLRSHMNLKKVFLMDTGIDLESIPDYLKEKVSNWDD